MTKLSDSLRKEIAGIGGDPDFVEFVLAWHGLIESELVRFTDETPSQTIIRRTKRRLRKVWGEMHHQEWKDILDVWRRRQKLILHKTLFRLEPKAEHPPHRPRNESKWITVCDLRNYFKGVTGRPQMELIRQALGLDGVYWTFATFNLEWHRRKTWFCETEAVDRLAKLEVFYTTNHDRVLETLQTGISLYERHSQYSQVKTEQRSQPVDGIRHTHTQQGF